MQVVLLVRTHYLIDLVYKIFIVSTKPEMAMIAEEKALESLGLWLVSED